MSPARPNILVIRRRYLGDIVLLGSVLRNLRLHWPAAQISVLVEATYADVLALNPEVDCTLVLPRRLREWPGFLRRVRSTRFTHILDFDNTEKTAAVARLSGAPFRLALHHGDSRVKLRGAYTHTVNDPAEEHETRSISEYYLRALSSAGVPIATREIRLVPKEADLAAMRRLVGATGRVLLVHPGSRSPWRVWPADRFAALCDHAQDALGAQVVLVGGPADATVLTEIRRHARTHLLSPPGALPLPQFAALAHLSAALLCHDSGPMHVAAAVGTPVIALYGSQNAELFRPIGTGHTLLRPPLPCINCVAPGKCVPGDSYHNFCVRNVALERVSDAVRHVLARAGA